MKYGPDCTSDRALGLFTSHAISLWLTIISPGTNETVPLSRTGAGKRPFVRGVTMAWPRFSRDGFESRIPSCSREFETGNRIFISHAHSPLWWDNAKNNETTTTIPLKFSAWRCCIGQSQCFRCCGVIEIVWHVGYGHHPRRLGWKLFELVMKHNWTRLFTPRAFSDKERSSGVCRD